MRVLILSSKFGMGHLAASGAIREKICGVYPEAAVKEVDLFEYIIPIFSDIIYKAFGSIALSHHNIYNKLVKLGNHDLEPFIDFFVYRFAKLVESFKPDLIISTWPLGAKYVGIYKKLKRNTVPYITCITDITSNKAWLSDETDAYMVGDFGLRDDLIALGIAEERIFVTGIPVKKTFTPPESLKSRNKILLMAGGLGIMDKNDPLIDALANSSYSKDLVIITGKNQDLFKGLKETYPWITVLGYTDDVAGYMKEAKLIVTKAGGVTIFEAITTLTPIFITDPFLAQEKENAAFIERNGFGLISDEDGAGALMKLIEDEGRLADMKRAMSRFVERLYDFMDLPEIRYFALHRE